MIRTAWNFTRSVGGSAVLTGIAVGMTVGSLLGDIHHVLIAIAVLAAAAIGVAAIHHVRRTNHHVDQILDDELDDPDPFNTRLRVYPDTDTTGETR